MTSSRVRSWARCGAAGTLAVMLALEVGAGGPERARAASWQQVMATESDSAVFLMTGGELIKGPFHLADRETLWAPGAGDRVSRLLVAPDGQQIAWLSRGGHRGPTALWIGGRGASRPRMIFPSLVPGDLGSVHFEAEMPTAADPVVRGARLLTPGPTGRGLSSNALEWTIDGRSVLCGSARGLIQSPADTGAARLLSEDRVIELRRLAPSPIYLAHMQQVGAGSRVRNPALRDPEPPDEGGMYGGQPRSQRLPEGHKTEAARALEERTTTERRVLLYLAGGRARLFDSSGLDPADLWTASEERVWWIHQTEVRVVRANDPTATVEIRAETPVTWIEWDAGRRALHWIDQGRVLRRPEGASYDSLVFELDTPIRRVIEPERGSLRLLVTGTRLVLWDLVDDSRRALESEGIRAAGLFVGQGKVFVSAAGGVLRGGPFDLYRADTDSGRLVRVPTPSVKGARLVATPSGSKLVLYRPGSKPPAAVQVFDVASGEWTEVTAPGIGAWEPLGE